LDEQPGHHGPWEGDSILLVDRDPFFIETYERTAWRLGLKPIGTVASGGDALALMGLGLPSLVVVRVEVVEREDDGGQGFVREALAIAREIKMIMIGEYSEERVRHALASGAVAYLLPDTDLDDLAWTVRQVYRRTVYVAERRLAAVASWPDSPDLTARERQVLALVVDGHGNKAIAFRLAISEETVKFHLSNVFRKLNVSNRTGASREAHRLGLLERTG
jgi:DNA-binding NarL/FixJ family response regulator